MEAFANIFSKKESFSENLSVQINHKLIMFVLHTDNKFLFCCCKTVRKVTFAHLLKSFQICSRKCSPYLYLLESNFCKNAEMNMREKFHTYAKTKFSFQPQVEHFLSSKSRRRKRIDSIYSSG